MSESDTWSEHDDADGGAEPPPVAEQMKAATRSLRAHLSLVRDVSDDAPAATG